MIGLKCYDAKSKDHHRHWVLNRILERSGYSRGQSLQSPPAPVAEQSLLYLIGPQDIDGSLFESRGFMPENITAVDNQAACVDNARGCGRVAIKDDVGVLLSQWNKNPLSVLHLDSCSTHQTCRRILWAAFCGGAIDFGSVVYVNMIRGRDAERSDDEKRYLRSIKADVGVHRGEWLYAIFRDLIIELTEKKRKIDEWPPAASALWRKEMELLFDRYCNPVFDSYRSSVQTMDSVVMRVPGIGRGVFIPPKASPRRVRAARGKLAAAKALQTKMGRR